MTYLLVKTDYRKVSAFMLRVKVFITLKSLKQWRWSSFGNYYIHNIVEKRTYPMIPPTNPSRTAYATWAPTGDAIAYVTDNDLYVLPSASYVSVISLSTINIDLLVQVS